MMFTGKDIMERIALLVSDEEYTRWSLAEIAKWINDGVSSIVLAQPSACSTTRIIELAEGTLQTLSNEPLTAADKVPANKVGARPLRIIDAVVNIESVDPFVAGRSITPCGRNILDSQEPHWHSNTGVRFKKSARHIIYDDDNPDQFYVFPGNDGTGMIEVIMSVLPVALTASGPETELNSYSAEIGLKETYLPVLLDYVLYRCFTKDDLQGQAQRAQMHYVAFAQAVGIKVQNDKQYQPNTRRGGD